MDETCEVMYRTAGTGRTHPKLLAFFGILELRGSAWTVSPPRTLGYPQHCVVKGARLKVHT